MRVYVPAALAVTVDAVNGSTTGGVATRAVVYVETLENALVRAGQLLTSCTVENKIRE